MKNLFSLLFIACCLFSMNSVQAQIEAPAASPHSTLQQRVGLTDITIVYSRPGMKGRTIFGELVPYNKVWRTGANQATTIEFSDDVTIKGKKLNAGKYSLYTFPGKEEWTVIFNKDWRHWGTQYEKDGDAVRVKVKPFNISPSVESFTIDINDLRNSTASLVLKWADTGVKVPFRVPTDSKTMANIKDVMSGPSARDYYVAARYYFVSGKDLKQALNWISTSIEMHPSYFKVHKKALILAELGMKDEAIKTAKKSLQMAKDSGDDHYVYLNNKVLKEWGAK